MGAAVRLTRARALPLPRAAPHRQLSQAPAAVSSVVAVGLAARVAGGSAVASALKGAVAPADTVAAGLASAAAAGAVKVGAAAYVRAVAVSRSGNGLMEAADRHWPAAPAALPTLPEPITHGAVYLDAVIISVLHARIE